MRHCKTRLSGEPCLINQLSIDTATAFCRAGQLDVADQLSCSLAAPHGERNAWWTMGIRSARAVTAVARGPYEAALLDLDIAVPLAASYEGTVPAIHLAVVDATLSRHEGQHRSHELLDQQIAYSRALLMPVYEVQFVAEIFST
ncbi:MAG: hypothetical protein ACI82G_003329 [Bradymonadia bacterium]|jgi:hypothetical protein